jgi:iron complex transport system ATP-binding protein
MTAPGASQIGTPDVAIGIHGVGVSLDGHPVLSNVDMSIGAGEWVTVIGPNGAGKSTLLRAVAGLVACSGRIELCGHRVDRLAPRRRARLVATVPQTPVVPPGASVLDYVLLGRTPYLGPLGRESAADVAAASAVLSRLDLAGFTDRRLESLSGGERQRVFLARALAQAAPVLLLDEPTAALDIGHQQEVLELVDELRREQGLSVLSTMHELSIAGEYADRMVMLAGGHVVAAGEPRAVLTEALLAQHYRAQVRVIDSVEGPVVVPIRTARPQP